VGIYEHSIQEGINLLNTWVRERDPPAPDLGREPNPSPLRFHLDTLKFHTTVQRLLKHGESVLKTGHPLDSWTNDENCNYHLGPIQKWSVPVVLKRLKMAGVWRYARYWGEMEPHHCQEIVAFLDRVMPFLKKQFDPTYMMGYTAKEFVSEIKAFKRVFELCPEDGSVVMG